MTLTRQQKIAFYRNRKKIDSIILKEIKRKKLILFGARSLNKQLPPFLRKETRDYDIIVTERNPRVVAKQLERKLDKKFKGNLFIVQKGKAKGVFKVKRVLGKEGVIDVVRSNKKVPFVKRKGLRLSTLEFEQSKIKESLSNPKARFRHDKDRERRERINISKSLRRRRRRKVTRRNISRNKFRPRSGFRVRTPRFNSRVRI
jgi:hypothetical protein